MAYRRRANCRFVPTVVKIANADCVCSGAQRAPCRLAMITAQIQRRKASRFVIARSEATWQSRSIRPDHRALPANTVTLRGIALRTPPSTRRVRSAIIPPNLGPARRSGNAATPHTLAFAVFTADCTGRKCAAGSGMPLPYGGLVKLSAFRFQVSTCRSPAFYFLCFANRNAPMRADRGTARITPTELAMACTISTEKNVPLMSWENDGSSEER